MRLLVFLLLVLTGVQPAAGAEQAALSPEVARGFTEAHTLVEVQSGRKMNLYCMGEGQRTVLFDSGGSDWSVIWALVQPALATNARACTYDRAGLGYSDAAPDPRSPIAIVEDMHAVIHSGQLKAPLVLVGHSLGGFNAKLYAALYPEDVAGMVLVDPAEERSWDRTRSLITKQFGDRLAAKAELLDQWFFGRLTQRYERCAAEARPNGLAPSSDAYRRCTDPVRQPLGPLIAAERQRLQADAKYQSAQASEIISSVYGDLDGDAVYARLFRSGMLGSRPLIVLTHGTYDPEDPLDALSQAQALELHRETARLSKIGLQRTVPNSLHNIEIDAPDAIVEAVREVLGKLGG
jgi:pimeloyl-ACP methyl ester carboxylesterase